jgi:hypothetical protein
MMKNQIKKNQFFIADNNWIQCISISSFNPFPAYKSRSTDYQNPGLLLFDGYDFGVPWRKTHSHHPYRRNIQSPSLKKTTAWMQEVLSHGW